VLGRDDADAPKRPRQASGPAVLHYAYLCSSTLNITITHRHCPLSPHSLLALSPLLMAGPSPTQNMSRSHE